ncbi:hypothetical protein JCM19992_04690 [Thermostilla marina]
MQSSWESELASFLTDLSAIQQQSLDILTRKRQSLASVDMEELANVDKEEAALAERLQELLERREALLTRAKQSGLPAENVRSLAAAVQGKHGDLSRRANEASRRARLLQHNALTNWLIIQRTLIHLSQLLEIIATGGESRPTYNKDNRYSETANCGSLINQEA